MKLSRLLIYFILGLPVASLCAAQSLIFVSPNTREHLSDQDAIASLDSFEENNFLAVAGYLSGRICARPKAGKSEGLDGPGAENSALITGCTGKNAIYVAELLGRYAHQKFVLIFSPHANGPERLWIVTVPSGQPAEALQQLRQHGITAATVVAEEQNVRIFIWEQDHSQDQQVRALTADNHGEIQELAGKGQLIGADDRGEAQHVFDKAISGYEQRRKVKLSALLWSRWLRDLGLRASAVP